MESIKSPSGVHQEYQDFIRTPDRVRQDVWLSVTYRHRATFIHGQCYSILPAFTSDGFIALDNFEGSVNKDHFMWFLNEELVRRDANHLILTCIYAQSQTPKLGPYPGVRSVVVMDNCFIYHDEEVWAIVEGECGMSFYLPANPY